MKLAIAGAGGRMGRVLARIVHETPDCEIAGAIEVKGSPHVGADAGTLAGLPALGVAITDDPLPLFTFIDGLLDFTVPAASLALAELSAQARIVHVIGTTGIDANGDAKIKAASRHARIVKSGNMSVGVNLLASLVKKAAASLGDDFDIEILEMHTSTRSTRHRELPSSSARRRPTAEASSSARNRCAYATAIPARGRKAPSVSRR